MDNRYDRTAKKRNYGEAKRRADQSHSKSRVNLEFACFLLDREVLAISLISVLTYQHVYCNKCNVPTYLTEYPEENLTAQSLFFYGLGDTFEILNSASF